MQRIMQEEKRMKISWATDELFQIPDDILRQEDN